MKKNLLMLAVVIMTALAASAELSQSVVATLTHGSTITTFAGGNALREAHDAAVDGDAIVLSPGTFNAVDITKAITLRGAGAAALSLPDLPVAAGAATYITGNMSINIESTSHSFNIEGCQFSGIVTFSKAPATSVFKTRFDKISKISDAVASINFTHCSIMFDHQSSDFNKNTNMLNTYANYFRFNPYTKATNCILQCVGSRWNECWSAYNSEPDDGLLTNCIIFNDWNGYVQPLFANCTAYNCIALTQNNINNLSDFFKNSSNGTNKVALASDVLSTTSWPYTLTEAAATTYLGNDGTQVGIHGGPLPMDPIPDNLLVTSCNIASKTTADGKLSVEIKVSTAK